MLRYCILACLAALFSSCLNEPDCIITASNEVKIYFEEIDSDTARFIKFDRIEVSGTDSVFHVGDSVSMVTLPVNPGAYKTTFRFFYETEVDSLLVSYTRSTRVISPSCGAFNYFQDLDTGVCTFPLLIIENRQLSTSGAANLTVKL